MIATDAPLDLDLGLCTQVDPAVFFPIKGGSPRVAKAVCARCPIAPACLQDALDDPSLEGVWGGTTEREREHLRRDGAA